MKLSKFYLVAVLILLFSVSLFANQTTFTEKIRKKMKLYNHWKAQKNVQNKVPPKVQSIKIKPKKPVKSVKIKNPCKHGTLKYLYCPECFNFNGTTCKK